MFLFEEDRMEIVVDKMWKIGQVQIHNVKFKH